VYIPTWERSDFIHIQGPSFEANTTASLSEVFLHIWFTSCPQIHFSLFCSMSQKT
jgi:hypothetical protein